MNPADPMLAIRRILVALDASSSSMAALEAAVDMAVRMEAELLGIFVEDAELLRAAEFTCAREIPYPYVRPAPLSRTNLERALRTQAESARMALAGAAEKAQVPWSFRAVRGEVSPALLAAAGEADLIAVGKVGWSLGSVHLGSTALELASCTIPVLLLSEGRMPSERSLLVYDDGAPAASRALKLAARIAASDSRRVTVLLAVDQDEQVESLRKHAERSLAGRDLDVRYRVLRAGNAAELGQALRESPESILVIGGKEPLRKMPAIESTLRESSISLLLVRDGEEAG
jgi:nucleotide-binding universal stress UspA family protein